MLLFLLEFSSDIFAGTPTGLLFPHDRFGICVRTAVIMWSEVATAEAGRWLKWQTSPSEANMRQTLALEQLPQSDPKDSRLVWMDGFSEFRRCTGIYRSRSGC